MPVFARYVGIHYSGAETPSSSLSGLRVYLSSGGAQPVEVWPGPSPRKFWTRREMAEWLVDQLTRNEPTLVGIDHGFSFPLRYFERHGLALDWPKFLDDFQRHWPTDNEHTYVDFVREGVRGNGAARMGRPRWQRLTDQRAGSARSVFQFSGPVSAAKAAHAGIPWLRFIRRRMGQRAHFWPFDGWAVPAGSSAIAEVYPVIWRRSFARHWRNPAQHDAYCTAAWLSQADKNGSLATHLEPALVPEERTVAQVEGWVLGISGSGRTASTEGRSRRG